MKPESPTSIASPERRWRAATAPLIAAVTGWILVESVHLGSGPATSPGLSLTAKVIVICGAAAIGLGAACLIMRTRLVITAEGLADHRVFRVVRIPWAEIARFEINRPGALWGGFCVTAVSRHGATIDLMSTRAYSRIPSARHVDELYRICWTLQEAADRRSEQIG
ncbi:MAG TPA: PH domain-containing protein [Streptosporangiaceae bacterium]|nr:PH domain-containing protein [Streptosporangiaceae bacterium]